jgi:hypothetical protein
MRVSPRLEPRKASQTPRGSHRSTASLSRIERWTGRPGGRSGGRTPTRTCARGARASSPRCGRSSGRPVYAVLNACRTLQLLSEGPGTVANREEGARWALDRLPPEHRPLVERALACYRSPAPVTPRDARHRRARPGRRRPARLPRPRPARGRPARPRARRRDPAGRGRAMKQAGSRRRRGSGRACAPHRQRKNAGARNARQRPGPGPSSLSDPTLRGTSNPGGSRFGENGVQTLGQNVTPLHADRVRCSLRPGEAGLRSFSPLPDDER